MQLLLFSWQVSSLLNAAAGFLRVDVVGIKLGRRSAPCQAQLQDPQKWDRLPGYLDLLGRANRDQSVGRLGLDAAAPQRHSPIGQPPSQIVWPNHHSHLYRPCLSARPSRPRPSRPRPSRRVAPNRLVDLGRRPIIKPSLYTTILYRSSASLALRPHSLLVGSQQQQTDTTTATSTRGWPTNTSTPSTDSPLPLDTLSTNSYQIPPPSSR